MRPFAAFALAALLQTIAFLAVAQPNLAAGKPVPGLPLYLRYHAPAANLRATPSAAAPLAASAPGKEYLRSEDDGTNYWQVFRNVVREFNTQGAMVGEYEMRSSTGDTATKHLYTYSSQGALLSRVRLEKLAGWVEDTGVYLGYDSRGLLAWYLRKEYNFLTNTTDTALFTRFTHTLDARSRIAVTYYTDLVVYYARDSAGNPERFRYTLPEVRDSVYYQTPISRQTAGITRYVFDGAAFRPSYRDHLEIDSISNRILFNDVWLPDRQGQWRRYIQSNYTTLSNGDQKAVRYTFDVEMDTVVARENLELKYENRLNGAQTAVNYGQFYPELNNRIFYKSIRHLYTDGSTLLSQEVDSLEFDAQNRVLLWAHFQNQNSSDTNSTVFFKTVKYTFTQLGLVALRPASSGKSLGIAPDFTGQTALLVNLPAGQWQATLVDMQGRTTSLSSPYKSGVVQMPSLATGIYSMHLKDKTGRHLHGRFAWER